MEKEKEKPDTLSSQETIRGFLSEHPSEDNVLSDAAVDRICNHLQDSKLGKQERITIMHCTTALLVEGQLSLTAAQLGRLLTSLGTDTEKMDAVEKLNRSLKDPGNKGCLVTHFREAAQKKKVTEMLSRAASLKLNNGSKSSAISGKGSQKEGKGGRGRGVGGGRGRGRGQGAAKAAPAPAPPPEREVPEGKDGAATEAEKPNSSFSTEAPTVVSSIDPRRQMANEPVVVVVGSPSSPLSEAPSSTYGSLPKAEKILPTPTPPPLFTKKDTPSVGGLSAEDGAGEDALASLSTNSKLASRSLSMSSNHDDDEDDKVIRAFLISFYLFQLWSILTLACNSSLPVPVAVLTLTPYS